MAPREALLERIVQLGGLNTTQEASTVLRATLAALKQCLFEEDREVIAAALPGDLGAPLRQSGPQVTLDVAEFFEQVRRHERVSAGFGREHAQVACRALAEFLPQEALRRLVRALPGDFVQLFRPPTVSAQPPAPHVAWTARHHTLATGSGGARHPISGRKISEASD